MRELSTYYELAVRRNRDSVEDMRKAIWATYYHKFSRDDSFQHSYCPEGADSWCTYQMAEAKNLLKDFKHPPALSEEIQPLLKSIYEDLTSDDLLERCLGANTQNNNESFNAIVWNFAPKSVFAGKQIVDIAVFCAACTFNEGFSPLLKIMEVMGVTIGTKAAEFTERQDRVRIETANRRSSEVSKERRTAIRNERLEEIGAYEESEGIMYGAGIAD